jgi:KTSC domain
MQDIQIRSVGYDRRRGRLEIEFTWTDDVRQFYPIAPAVYRQLLAAKPEAVITPHCLWTIAALIAILRNFVTVLHEFDHPTIEVA